MTKEEALKKIDDERIYTGVEIAELGLFYWTNSYDTVVRHVNKDAVGRNLLNTEVDKYHMQIKGSDIRRFLEETEVVHVPRPIIK